MRHADAALEDDALLLIIQQELAKRCKKEQDAGSPTWLRRGFPNGRSL